MDRCLSAMGAREIAWFLTFFKRRQAATASGERAREIAALRDSNDLQTGNGLRRAELRCAERIFISLSIRASSDSLGGDRRGHAGE
jgi:hypothetical protein